MSLPGQMDTRDNAVIFPCVFAVLQSSSVTKSTQFMWITENVNCKTEKSDMFHVNGEKKKIYIPTRQIYSFSISGGHVWKIKPILITHLLVIHNSKRKSVLPAVRSQQLLRPADVQRVYLSANSKLPPAKCLREIVHLCVSSEHRNPSGQDLAVSKNMES